MRIDFHITGIITKMAEHGDDVLSSAKVEEQMVKYFCLLH